ncbi:hypothetical protein ACFX2H_023232 [Malus domestica]
MSTSASNNWLLTLKVALISTGVVSMAVGLKLSSPLVADTSSAISWLRPPYLYILINCIIISIVASSKLHPTPEDSHPKMEPELVMVPPMTMEKISTQIQSDYAAYNGVILSEYGYDANVLPKISDSYGRVVLEEKVWVSEAVKKKENREDFGTGGYRILSYLDPLEPKHDKLKRVVLYLLKSSRDSVLPEFHSSFTELFETLEDDPFHADRMKLLRSRSRAIPTPNHAVWVISPISSMEAAPLVSL